MIVTQFIDLSIPVLSISMNIQEMQLAFRESGMSHLPIIDNETYLGIVYEEDIQSLEIKNLLPIHLRKHKGIYINPKDNFLDALRLANQYQLKLMPIVDKDLKYRGSVTTETCYQYLITQTTLGEAGGILVLKVKKNDYSISEICRIIEMENSNILHFYIGNHNSANNELDIVVKVDSFSLELLEKALERYGFNVKAVFSEKAESSSMKERYDSLMAYLNV